MTGGHMEILPVTRDLETVRALHFGGELANSDRAFDLQPSRPELDAMDEIGGLGSDVHPIRR
jgi:hypothetical protein